MATIERVLGLDQDREPEPSFPGIFRGKVTRASASTLHFVIPSYSPDHEFGPAPYPAPSVSTGETSGGSGDASFAAHTHDLRMPANPPKGTSIAVAFDDGDVDLPLVLCLYDWPIYP